ncbi:MAG: hypothetical protein Q9207_007630 [Kuettlingeria erythrocarpa]
MACLSLKFAPGAFSDTVNDDEGRDKKSKRSNRARMARIRKRWGGETRTLLGHASGTTSCIVRPYTYKPEYPGPSEVAEWENIPDANPRMAPFYQMATPYWAVPTDEPNCGGPGWEYRGTQAVQVRARPEDPVWQVGGNRGANNRKIVNIDHVYEVSLLGEFFASRITPSFNCTDINTLFDEYDYTGWPDRVGTRLNTIFSQLASYSNPDLLGMDGELNNLKGNLWNPPLRQPFGLQKMPRVLANNGLDYLKGLFSITLVMVMANDPAIRTRFESTNGRIFKAFAGIDELIRHEASRNCPYRDHNDQPMSATWASAYSEWIGSKISLQNMLIVATVGVYSAGVPIIAAPGAPPAARARTASWSRYMSNYNNRYNINSLTFPAMTAWPAGHLPMQKRANSARTASCTRVDSMSHSTLAAPGSTFPPASSTVPPSMTLRPINTSIQAASTTTAVPRDPFGNTSSNPAAEPPSTASNYTVPPTRDNGDPCGPVVHDTADYPDTCNATVKGGPFSPPAAYGVQCQAYQHGWHTLGRTAWRHCFDSIPEICAKMSHPSTPNNTWIWSQRRPSCALGFFLPPYPGSAPIPSRKRCETMIFTAMVRACANWLPIDVASVNLKGLPTVQGGKGVAVDVGYPSYVIASSKLGQ